MSLKKIINRFILDIILFFDGKEIEQVTSKSDIGLCIVDRILVTDKAKDILTVQQVSPPIYETEYPCRVFAKQKLLNYIQTSFELVEEYQNYYGSPVKMPEGTAVFYGFIFRRKK